MTIFAIVFEDNKKELVGKDCLFADEAKAGRVRDDWNRDYPAFTTRNAIVVPMEVEE